MRAYNSGEKRWVKIATFNVNGINGRLPVLLRWLAETAPDVVCLQELKAPQERFPAAALRDAGYGAIWHGQKSWNGVAILARGANPTETGRRLPGDLENSQSSYIEQLPASSPAASNCRTAIRRSDRSSTSSLDGSSAFPPTPPNCLKAACRWCSPAISHRTRRLQAGALGR